MFGTLFPGLGEWISALSARANQLVWLAAACILLFGAWRMHWRSRYARRMKQTFELTNLFVKPRKDKLFPELISLSKQEDELYYVFRYRLRPGMSIPQFEDKKKLIEAAFNAEARVFGKGGIVTIKVKKEPYPVPNGQE